MTLRALFRATTFLCLILSTACLGYTERSQLQGSVVFYAFMGLSILAAYLADERYLMSSRVANLVAMAILLGWIAWFLAGMEVEDADPIGSLLPRAGPLLGLLLLAKLFRAKSSVDYWLLHGLGLIQVLLACVLALRYRLDREDPVFVVLLLAYVLSLIWALVYFNLYREHMAAEGERRPVRQTARRRSRPRRLGVPIPWPSLAVVPTFLWFLAAFVIGLVIFFTVPRSAMDAATTVVVPGSLRSQVGFNPGMDLTATGPIEISDEEVMRIEVRDINDQAVRLDLDQQRWRGVTCSVYEKGRWKPLPFQDGLPVDYPAPRAEKPGDLVLTFYVDLAKLQSDRTSAFVPRRRFGGLSREQPIFYAEPVYDPRGFGMPLVALVRGSARRASFLSYRRFETSLHISSGRQSRRLVYQQLHRRPTLDRLVWSYPAYFNLTSVFHRNVWDELHRIKLKDAERKRIADYAKQILAEAGVSTATPAAGSASASELAALRERQARTLANYFLRSPEFTYSLDRPRQDYSIDPTVDFLCNVKQGHCELYASALTLMLRSQGIPARVVIGFRGAEWNETGDFHEVRQYHSHAWVEAFIEDPSQVPARMPRRPGRQLRYGRWLTLDPTPAGGTAGAAGSYIAPGILEDQMHFLQFLWEFFILDYSGDLQRAKLMARLRNFQVLQRLEQVAAWLRPAAIVLSVGALLLLVVYGAIRWRRRRSPAAQAGTSVPFFARFLKLLESLPLRPRPAQTAAEFGAEASLQLQRHPATASLAEAPFHIVRWFYAVRFGRHSLAPSDEKAIDRDLALLEQALKRRS